MALEDIIGHIQTTTILIQNTKLQRLLEIELQLGNFVVHLGDCLFGRFCLGIILLHLCPCLGELLAVRSHHEVGISLVMTSSEHAA